MSNSVQAARLVKSKAIVHCSDCDKELLQLLTLHDPIETCKLRVKCPFCGGASFLIPLQTEFKIASIETLLIQDIVVDDDKQTVILKKV